MTEHTQAQPKPDPGICFLDLETTGLDPDKGIPLECSVFLDSPGCQGEASWLIDTPLEDAIPLCDDYVAKMHEENGLWLDLARHTPYGTGKLIAPGTLDATLCAWARERFKGKPPIGGFNPAFDVRWLRRFAPEFLTLCDYHTFDVSTLIRTVRTVYPQTHWGPSQTVGRHRALGDTCAAVEYWRWYRAHVMTPYGRASL